MSIKINDLDFREWMNSKHPILFMFLWNQFSEYERKKDEKRKKHGK